MRDKEEKTGRGKEEKKRRKGENNWGPNRKKVRAHLFPLPCRLFYQSDIRYLGKNTIYLLLFSCKICSMNKLCDF